MTETVQRRRIEVLVDGPLARLVVEAAKTAGISSYTILPTLEGQGSHGHWSDDQLTGALAKVMFLSVTSEDKAKQFVENIEPLLDSHGLVLMLSSVDVIRGGKF